MKKAEYKKDRYQKLAKKEGYRSRAAYKLLQIERAHTIFDGVTTVVDVGASPGGWSQASKEILGDAGTVIALDLTNIRPIEGVTFVKGDITSEDAVAAVKNLIESADLVLSDAAPHLSGQKTLDHARSIDIAEHVLEFAEKILSPGGNFVVKVFQGESFGDYMKKVREKFAFCKGFSPKASRTGSAELYVVAKGFRFD